MESRKSFRETNSSIAELETSLEVIRNQNEPAKCTISNEEEKENDWENCQHKMINVDHRKP